jgi:hypothetical protein
MLGLITEKQGLSDFTFDVSKKLYLIINEFIFWSVKPIG